MKNTAFAGALTTIALCGIVFGLTCVSKNILTQRKATIGSESLAESTSDRMAFIFSSIGYLRKHI